MPDITKSFLGTGWSFPPSFSNITGQVVMTSDVADIECSLQILLSTTRGERVMLPDYGCNLDVLLFEPITITLISYISDMIKKSVMYYEPRITLNNIDVSPDDAIEGRILISLDYTVKSTNSRFNYVFPFYKNEKTSAT